jgi:hypothetical protein
MHSKSKTIIRKAFCISLALFFSLSIFATGVKALSVPECKDDSCMKSSMLVSRHGMEIQSPSASHGCCSGDQSAPCDFEKGQNTDVPDIAALTVRPDNYKTSYSLSAAINYFSNNSSPKNANIIFRTRATARSSPLYLTNSSFLC